MCVCLHVCSRWGGGGGGGGGSVCMLVNNFTIIHNIFVCLPDVHNFTSFLTAGEIFMKLSD